MIDARPAQQLKARVADLEAALRPFAEEGKVWLSPTHKDAEFGVDIMVSVGDLRRAAQLLESGGFNASSSTRSF